MIFIPDLSIQMLRKKKVLVGRIWTIALIVLSIVLALYLESALQVFQYMLLIGAGTGLIYLLRWFCGELMLGQKYRQ